MQCVICKHGRTAAGTTTVTLQRNDATIVIRDVPAEVCENCGEYYLSDKVTARVQAIAEHAVSQGAEIEVLRYAA